MDEHKKVRITMNNNEPKIKKHDLEYILTPKNVKQSNRFSNFRQPLLAKLFKPILFAIILGAIFGIGFIYYFSDLTPPQSVPVVNQNDDDGVKQTDDNNESNEQSNNQTTFEFTSDSYEVVQFGLFSNIENAKEHANFLNNNQIPSVVHFQDGNYYVLSMTIFSEQLKGDTRSWLENKGFEYMEDFLFKTWSFPSKQINGESNEVEWLNEGQQLISSNPSAEWLQEVETWVSEAPEKYKSNDYMTNLSNVISKYKDQSFPIYRNTADLNMRLFFSNLE